MDDSHTVCPECNCDSFETEEILKDDNNPANVEADVQDDSPTKIIDAVKVETEIEESAELENETENAEEQEYIQPPRKLKPWQIGAIIGAVVVVLGVVIAVLSGAFSGTNRHYKNAKVETPSDIVTEPTDIKIKNTAFVMTEEPFDMQIKIESFVYQLPMMVKDVLASGWSFGESDTAEIFLASGEVLDTYFVSAKGSVIFVKVKNFDKDEAEINNCCLIGLKVDADCLAGEKAVLVKNLTMGSLRKAVEDVFGECDDVTEENKGTTLTYTRWDKRTASFVFDSKGEKLISVQYFNDAVPENFEAFEEETKANTDNEKDGYVKPTALGNDVASGIMQIEGELYQFPILVSEFLDNGWEITFEEDRAILFAEEHLFGTLKKGDIEITGVDVYNFEKSDCRIKNCYVVSMESSADSEYSAVLPKNVKVGMNEEAFTSAIIGAAYDFDSTHFNEYVFTRGAYSLVIDVDKDEKTIVYWYAAYDVAYEE